jgi:hypothetical protein
VIAGVEFDPRVLPVVIGGTVASLFLFWRGWLDEGLVTETFQHGLRITTRRGQQVWYWKRITEFMISPYGHKRQNPDRNRA